MAGQAPRRWRIVLHIGTEKTGSTSVQAVLARHRAALPPHGFAYPEAPGAFNHLGIAAFAASEDKRVADLCRDLGVAGGPPELRAALPGALDAELSALPGAVHTLVFSAEHCHSRLLSVPEVARLKALLDPYADSYLVVAYLRRQDEVEVSLNSTRLRVGQVAGLAFPPPARVRPYYDYEAMLDRWAEVFGPKAIRPRLYAEAMRSHPSGVVEDFRRLIGLPELDIVPADRTHNPSLRPEAQAFLLLLNRHGGRESRASLTGVLNSLFAGPGRRPHRAAAREFLAAFAEGNERLRARWFPGRGTLFDDDFSDYPEAEEPPTSGEAVAEVGAIVAHHLMRELEIERARTAYAEGCLRRAEGDVGAARQAFLLALRRMPAHIAALRALAELADGDPQEVAALQALLRRAREADPGKTNWDWQTRRCMEIAAGEASGGGSAKAS